MTQLEVFLKTLQMLERLEINYMVCGSVAAVAYGEPRFTRDLDVVIALRPAILPQFEKTCAQEGFYCPPAEAMLTEIRRGGMFNLIHQDTGIKIDCITLGRDDFGLTEFKRRKQFPYPATDFMVQFASPEDVIIKKLEFFKQGGSDKHLTDIRAMLRVSGDQMDMEYLKGWVKELDLETEWKKVTCP